MTLDSDAIAAERVWRSSRPLDVRLTLSALRRGGGDPTWQIDRGLWKTFPTPAGAVTLRLQQHSTGEVLAAAWGAGRDWMLDALPTLLGEGDDAAGFVTHHEVVRRAQLAHPGWRVPRTELVLDALVPSCIEQKVTGREAFSAYRTLVRRFGTPAPGPAPTGLMVAPDAAAWRAVPSWEWALAGVDQHRAAAAAAGIHYAGRLEEVRDDVVRAKQRLRALPGVGVWTVAEVAQRALGDADAVSFGDYHVAANLGWALLGRVIDDAELAEVLAPYAGHRYRVQRLLELDGHQRPRRGPRRSLPGHLPRRG